VLRIAHEHPHHTTRVATSFNLVADFQSPCQHRLAIKKAAQTEDPHGHWPMPGGTFENSRMLLDSTPAVVVAISGCRIWMPLECPFLLPILLLMASQH
jgi:hypothetical protein